MTTTPTPIDPESLVARIMEELRANPAAQQLLMQALLSREFLGMPLRLERIEAQLDVMLGRMDSIEEGQRRLDDFLTFVLPGRIIPLLGQKKIRLRRRAEIMLNPRLRHQMSSELADAIADAVDAGVLEDWQEARIGLTDIIVRAQRRADRSPVWLAVEASGAIHRRDIERARQSADSLAAAFRQDAIAVVAGYEIDPEENRQADDVGVEVLIVE